MKSGRAILIKIFEINHRTQENPLYLTEFGKSIVISLERSYKRQLRDRPEMFELLRVPARSKTPNEKQTNNI